MAKIIMLCGKICSGKSTYAEQLKKKYKAVILSCDELMLTLFDEQLGDKHNMILKKCQNYLYQLAEQIIESDTNVILDFGFWDKTSRVECKEYFVLKNIETELHYIKIDHDTWLKHIEKRNIEAKGKTTKCYYIDKNMEQLFDKAFEEPEQNEVACVVDNTSGGT